MSFSFGFTARACLVEAHLRANVYAPYSVKQFIEIAVRQLKPQALVRVEANGHLAEAEGSYPVSSATIKVEPIEETI